MGGERWVVQDRIKTRAISLYLADNREVLCQKLPARSKRADKNAKRNALLHLARRAFRIESSDVQCRYVQRASALRPQVRRRLRRTTWVKKSGGSDAATPRRAGEEQSSGCGEVSTQTHPAVEQTSVCTGEEQTSGCREVLTHTRLEVEQLPVCAGKEQTSGCREVLTHTRPEVEQTSSLAHAGLPRAATMSTCHAPPWERRFQASCVDPQAEVRSCITKHIGVLRTFYGDTAAAETFSASLRVLDQFCGSRTENAVFSPRVRAAAVIGLAMKMVLRAELVDAVPVSQVWSRIAGSHRLSDVRLLEMQLVNRWPGLERDYVQLGS